MGPGRQGWRRGSACIAIVAAIFASPVVVEAQDPIARALSLYSEGEFERARESIDALSVEGPSERARVALLRARIDAALGDTASMERDTLSLAVLDPEGRALGPEVVPEVRDAFERARGLLRNLQVRVDAHRESGRVRIEGRARDPRGVGGGVRVWGRRVAGAWAEGADSLSFEAPPGESVEYYAEVLGPGGLALLSDGTRADPRVLAPLVLEVAPVLVTASSGVGAAAPEGVAEGVPWAWIGVGIGGGVAVVAGAVVLGFVLASAPTDTVLGVPVYPFGTPVPAMQAP